jgi:Protein of unknown function (DUF2845)
MRSNRLPCLHGLLLMSLVSLGVPSPAFADGMRCGSDLVHDGDGRAKVLRLCGEPTDVENRSIMRRPYYQRGGRTFYYGHEQVAVPVEIWTYNFGPSKFMRRIRFVDGLIEEIETLGYGYHER